MMPLRHPRHYYDVEVGVFYNYFRDYDPATGRYLQSDPIGLDGGLNTYGYVGGNSLTLVDPQGLASIGGLLGTGARAVGNCPIGLLVQGVLTSGNMGTYRGPNPTLPPQECKKDCDPPAGVKFNKVTHYNRHGRSPDPNDGSHGCMAKTGSPVHWHYDVNDQLPDGRCITRRHVFGGCGVAPL